MRHIIEWFKETAGVWIVIGIISIVFLFYGASKTIGFTSGKKMSEKEIEMQNMKFNKYDDVWITGSEVMQAVKKYQKETPVRIYNGESAVSYHGDFLKTNNNKKSERYIDAADSYKGKVLLDEDGIAACLVFSKKGVDLTEVDYDKILSDILDGEKGSFSDLIEKLKKLIKELAQKVTNSTNKLNKITSENAVLKNQYDSIISANTALNTAKNTLNTQINQTNQNITKKNEDYRKLLEVLKNLGIDIDGSLEEIVDQIDRLQTGHVHDSTCGELFTFPYQATAFKVSYDMIENTSSFLSRYFLIEANYTGKISYMNYPPNYMLEIGYTGNPNDPWGDSASYYRAFDLYNGQKTTLYKVPITKAEYTQYTKLMKTIGRNLDLMISGKKMFEWNTFKYAAKDFLEVFGIDTSLSGMPLPRVIGNDIKAVDVNNISTTFGKKCLKAGTN